MLKCKSCGTEFEGKFCPHCGTQYMDEMHAPDEAGIHREYRFRGAMRDGTFGGGRRVSSAVIDGNHLTISRIRAFRKPKEWHMNVSQITELQRSTYITPFLLLGELACALCIYLIPLEEMPVNPIVLSILVLLVTLVCAANKRLEIISISDHAVIDSASQNHIDEFTNTLSMHPSFQGVVRKKRHYWQWVLVGLMIVLMVLGCSRMLFASDDAMIAAVTEGTFEDYPEQTVGEAFDAFFDECKWEYFVSEDDKHVVEFNGTYDEAGKTSDVCIQFEITDDKFEIQYFSSGDAPATTAELEQLLEQIFEGKETVEIQKAEQDAEKTAAKEVDTAEDTAEPEPAHTEEPARTEKPAQTESAQEATAVGNEYIIPDSNTKKYSTDEIRAMGLTKETARIARNEIYARHGYMFQSDDLKAYFAAKSWYTSNANFSENSFSEVEKANIQTLQSYEESQGWRASNTNPKQVAIDAMQSYLVAENMNDEWYIDHVEKHSDLSDGGTRYFVTLACAEGYADMYPVDVYGNQGIVQTGSWEDYF